MKATDAREANKLVEHSNELKSSIDYLKQHHKPTVLMHLTINMAEPNGSGPLTSARISNKTLQDALIAYRDEVQKKAMKLGVDFPDE